MWYLQKKTIVHKKVRDIVRLFSASMHLPDVFLLYGPVELVLSRFFNFLNINSLTCAFPSPCNVQSVFHSLNFPVTLKSKKMTQPICNYTDEDYALALFDNRSFKSCMPTTIITAAVPKNKNAERQKMIIQNNDNITVLLLIVDSNLYRRMRTITYY